MIKHKWHKEICAWANGAEIEGRLRYDDVSDVWGHWHPMITPNWTGGDDVEYRIKQQPKKPQYLYAWKNNMAEISFIENPPHPLKAFVNKSFTYIGKIKLEQDDE